MVYSAPADAITVEGGEALRSSAAAARCPERAAGASTSPGHLREGGELAHIDVLILLFFWLEFETREISMGNELGDFF